jgi:hypothetical protein
VTSLSDAFVDFARREAHGASPTYERLAHAVAANPGLLTLIGSLPAAKRQPNLLFSVVRHLGGPVGDPAAFHDFAVGHWPAIAAEAETRSTQTNEVGRCALLLPVLAALPQPLALLEVGTSAGLNLYPDRYAYRYGAATLGTSPLVLDCDATGLTPPTRLPTVAWRGGIDLNPLDVTDPADLSWLLALTWPEHEHRRTRLRLAADILATDKPHLVRGDLVDDLPALAAQAPADATLVVFHTSVLYYVPAPRRAAFADLLADLLATRPGHWLACDDPAALSFDRPPPAAPDDTWHNVLTLDGRPLAWTSPHGQAMTWFG